MAHLGREETRLALKLVDRGNRKGQKPPHNDEQHNSPVARFQLLSSVGGFEWWEEESNLQVINTRSVFCLGLHLVSTSKKQQTVGLILGI